MTPRYLVKLAALLQQYFQQMVSWAKLWQMQYNTAPNASSSTWQWDSKRFQYSENGHESAWNCPWGL